MTPDELDRILSAEDILEPSSGFAMDVMSAVRRQASEPPPIPFPWVRFVAGLAASGVMAASATILVLHFEIDFASLAPSLAPLASALPELSYAMSMVFASLGLAALPRLLLLKPE